MGLFFSLLWIDGSKKTFILHLHLSARQVMKPDILSWTKYLKKNKLLHAGVSFITSKLVVIWSQWSNRYRYIDDGDWCFPNMLFVYLAHMYVLNPLYQNDMTCPVRGVCRATFNVLLLRGSKCSCHCNTRDMCAIPFPMLLRCLTNWTV